MCRISRHSKERIIQRSENTRNFADAEKMAKQARISGKNLNHFQRYPRFFSYLQNKVNQTNTCSLRVYKNNIYIWRGKTKMLVTAHPIPQRYIDEMEKVNGGVRS